VDLAEQANEGLWGHDQPDWLDRLEAELDNLRAVLEWSMSPSGDLEAGFLVAGGTCRFWDMRGYFAEGRARLEALLARADAVPWPRSDDRVGRAEVYTRLAAGFLAFAQGDFPTSTAHVNRAMPLARELGFTFGVTVVLIGLASMAQIRGELAAAAAWLNEALALGRAANDERSIYHALYWQGEIARAAGDYDRAVGLLEASLNRQEGNAWLATSALFSLGHVALVQSETERAAALFRETLDRCRRLGDRLGLALSVEGLAWVAATNRRPELAARLFGAADGLRERIGVSVEVGWTSDHERYLEQTRTMLDEPTFGAEWAAGRVLAPDEAIALALSTGGVEPPPVEGIPSSSRVRHAPHAPRHGSPLTRRERQVVGLIARGLTNREIAAELVITEGTAANYVQHVLEKLGFHSRSQVAAWAVEHNRRAHW
jgi:DNA-binding CsgD family transcriptional regulator/tetratricopeptide (TPR) repeat protein